MGEGFFSDAGVAGEFLCATELEVVDWCVVQLYGGLAIFEVGGGVGLGREAAAEPPGYCVIRI